MSDEVKVQGSGGIGLAPFPSKGLFDLVQRFKRREGTECRLDNHDAIRIGRHGGVWPGSGPPPSGPGDDRQSKTGKLVQGGDQQVLGSAVATGKIATDADQHLAGADSLAIFDQGFETNDVLSHRKTRVVH